MSLKEKPTRIVSALFITLALSATVLAQVERKVATAVLIDNTGSMRSQFNLVINLGRGIAAQAQPRGPVKLFNFMPQGSGPGSIALISSKRGWTEDQGSLDATIDDLYVVPGQTKLVDAIMSLALDLNEKVALNPDSYSSKVIFLVTDGEDRSSKISTKDLIKLLKDSNIQVNAIGLVEELENDRFGSATKRADAKDLLERLTKETGGRVVFTGRRAAVDDVLQRLWNK